MYDRSVSSWFIFVSDMLLVFALYRKKFSYFYHTLRNCSYLILQDKSLVLLGGKESSWAEYERKYGFIGIEARRAVIAGHVVVIRRNVLHCSGGAGFSCTCKPSINHGYGRSAFTHTEHTQAHPHNPSHAPSKKKKKECCEQSSIRSTEQHQRQHRAEMYKNPQNAPSLKVH